MKQPARMQRLGPALSAAFTLLAILTVSVPTNAVSYTSVLPIVITPPGQLTAHDEDSLRTAFEAANAADQLPSIDLLADITLTEPLPPLDNPRAGTATIAGNNHILSGDLAASLLTIGPGTVVVIEQLTITSTGEQGIEVPCGGGIHNEGYLKLSQSRIIDNMAIRGGGICSIGEEAPATLILEETSVSGNSVWSTPNEAEGGGIFASGQVIVRRSLIADNWADRGGGIYMLGSGRIGSLLLEESTVANNRSAAGGGGVYVLAIEAGEVSLSVVETALSDNRAINGNGGALSAIAQEGSIYTDIRRSAITTNSANNGAGLYNIGNEQAFDSGMNSGFAWVDIAHSTLSGNIATANGGAITNLTTSLWPGARSNHQPFAPTRPDPPPLGWGSVRLFNSTVTDNWAQRGSGIFNGKGGWFEMFGSIVANNEPSGRDCWNPIDSNGYSLDSDDSCGLTQPTDQPAGIADLLPLALYPPGQTASHALGAESQARDRIPIGETGCNPAIDTDQRGVPRPQPAGGLCDIGAFETEGP